jgi:hypothetical protein
MLASHVNLYEVFAENNIHNFNCFVALGQGVWTAACGRVDENRVE